MKSNKGSSKKISQSVDSLLDHKTIIQLPRQCIPSSPGARVLSENALENPTDVKEKAIISLR